MIPAIHPIDHIALPEVIECSVANEIPLFEIRQPGCNVIKVEIVFLGGRPFEQKKIVSTCCAGLLKEGAGPLDSDQIAELIDFYGASLDIHASLDTISIRLVCLKKYLVEFLDLFAFILNRPSFKDSELDLLCSRRVEKLKIETAKNEVVSYRHLTEALFGENHPYGYNSSEELYKAVSLEDIRGHYKENIIDQKAFIFGAGDISEKEHALIEQIALLIPRSDKDVQVKMRTATPSVNRRLFFEGSPEQSSIKLGRMLFKKEHPDYPEMTVLNTLLGGYFGSRLVTRLREELGLTYGIYSSVDTFLYNGTFMVSTEVTAKNVPRSLDEIYREMRKLQEVKVSRKELDHVKKYIMGSYLNLFDGAFNGISAIKSLVLSKIPISELNSFINISKSVGPEQIRNHAQKYFNRNDFWEVVVGSSSYNT